MSHEVDRSSERAVSVCTHLTESTYSTAADRAMVFAGQGLRPGTSQVEVTLTHLHRGGWPADSAPPGSTGLAGGLGLLHNDSMETHPGIAIARG
jgi:hypothetical protein